MKSAWTWFGALLVIIAPAVVYWGSPGHGRLPEEAQIIWSNQAVTGPGAGGALQGLYYDTHMDGFHPALRPLSVLVLRQEWSQFYQHRAGYQWIQLVLLGLLGAAFGALLLRWFGSRWMAFLGALALVVHPVGAASTLNLAGLSDLLSELLVILALLMTDLTFRPRPGSGTTLPRVLSWLFLLLALWSKESAYAIVPVLLLWAWTQPRPVGTGREEPVGAARGEPLRFTLGLAAVLAVALAHRALVLAALPESDHLGRAFMSDSGVGWGRRVALGLGALPTSIGQLLFPSTMGYAHDHLLGAGLSILRIAAGGVAVAGLIWLLWRGGRKGSAYIPWAGLALFPFLAAAGFFGPVGDLVPYRILFLALPGAIGLFLSGLVALRPVLGGRTWERVALGWGVALVLLLGARSFMRNRDYRDWETLVKAQTAAYPSSGQGWFDSGNLYLTRGEWSAAITDYQTALQQRDHLWTAWVNLGTAYYGQNEFGLAMRTFQKVLDGVQGHPELAVVEAQALYNRALILMRQDRNQEAAESLERMLRIFPDHAAAHADLGMIYSNSDVFYDQALTHLRRARELELDTERQAALDDVILQVQTRRARKNSKAGVSPEEQPKTGGIAPN